MVRILNVEPEDYSAEARQILQGMGELVEEVVPQERLADRVQGFDALIVRLHVRVTDEVLAAADRLRVVVTATTGLDHIDLEAARKRGIEVISLYGETEFLRTIPATAEHTWALLLALVRQIPWAFQDVGQGNWDRDRFRGRDLRGKQLGILGLGRLGQQVARYGLTFGMQVGAYDPFLNEWPAGVQRFETLESFLRWSEILSIHLPLNQTTHGFLDKARLQLLPEGARVVNTARGAVWDEQAVVELLDTGHLAGAASDVLAEEQPAERREQCPLLAYAREHNNLLITPHIGGATIESMAMTEVFVARKLAKFLSNPVANKQLQTMRQVSV
jgi:D-3-phosphoglycerate dehydrogenase